MHRGLSAHLALVQVAKLQEFSPDRNTVTFATMFASQHFEPTTSSQSARRGLHWTKVIIQSEVETTLMIALLQYKNHLLHVALDPNSLNMKSATDVLAASAIAQKGAAIQSNLTTALCLLGTQVIEMVPAPICDTKGGNDKDSYTEDLGWSFQYICPHDHHKIVVGAYAFYHNSCKQSQRYKQSGKWERASRILRAFLQLDSGRHEGNEERPPCRSPLDSE